MNTTAQLTRVFHSARGHPTRGVVGLVDDLLALCPEQGLQLHWQAGQCRVQFFQGGSEEVVEVPLRKSVFRTMVARVAALCNERSPNSVSPYGGQGEVWVGANPRAVFRVRFANTPEDQKCGLIRVQDPRIPGERPSE